MFHCTAVGLLLHAGSPAPMVSPISFADLACYADAIVVGKVVRVVVLKPDEGPEGKSASRGESWRIAEVDVERVLRGNDQAKKLWYLAQGTWTCDVSDAVPNERALLFLTQTDPLRRADEHVHALAGELTGGQPILSDAWSGRGRLPIRIDDGIERVTEWEDVIPPEDLPRGPALHMAHPDIYWVARLDDVVAHVDRASRARPMLLPAHPVSGLPAELAIVVDGKNVVAAHWRDGTTIWSQDLVAGGAPYLRASSRAFDDLYRWTSGRELGPDSWQKDRFPPRSRTRVTMRLPLEAHDLGCPSPAAEELRAEILRRLPRAGEPFEGELSLR